jgi:hypothetical protein
MIVHHDRAPVYTGYRWPSQLLLKDEVRLSYALGGAEDNPEMESFHGRFKAEGESLFSEVQTLAELKKVVAQRMQYYNVERRRSSLDHVSALTFIARTWSTAET